MPFNNNYFIENLKALNNSLPSIKGIVFTYGGNPQITNSAPSTETPKILSFMKDTLIDENQIGNRSFPMNTDSIVVQSHFYKEYCDVMLPAYKYFIIAL